MLFEPVLGQGYAVVNSTGLRTNTHYNLQLGGETALMLKEHFIEDHGVPRYTVGVGGSGGAIQQYVYAQNHPGLLDAAIPQYSYPDMVTQTIHVGDCELLEHYFDVTDRANPTWRDPETRQAIMGLNASDSPKNLSQGEIEQWNLLYALYGLLGYQVMDQRPGLAGRRAHRVPARLVRPHAARDEPDVHERQRPRQARPGHRRASSGPTGPTS